MKIKNSNKGVSLYLTIMVLAIILAIALGVNTIFLGQTKMMREIGNSVMAFYAADAGIERVLLERTNPVDIPKTPLDNGATYQVWVVLGGTEGCSATNFCIKSVGAYQEIRRAIEISY